MRIAVATDDGRTISQHFGMAEHYLVFEIEGGTIKEKEMRQKMSHQHDRGVAHHSGGEHSLHGDMLSNVRDCEAIVARGMGRPMYEAILQMGIRPYVTGMEYVEEAVHAYINGTLDDQTEKLH